jgi:hypothetical protein
MALLQQVGRIPKTQQPSTKMKLEVIVKSMLEQNPTMKGFIDSMG